MQNMPEGGRPLAYLSEQEQGASSRHRRPHNLVHSTLKHVTEYGDALRRLELHEAIQPLPRVCACEQLRRRVKRAMLPFDDDTALTEGGGPRMGQARKYPAGTCLT